MKILKKKSFPVSTTITFSLDLKSQNTIVQPNIKIKNNNLNSFASKKKIKKDGIVHMW